MIGPSLDRPLPTTKMDLFQARWNGLKVGWDISMYSVGIICPPPGWNKELQKDPNRPPMFRRACFLAPSGKLGRRLLDCPRLAITETLGIPLFFETLAC